MGKKYIITLLLIVGLMLITTGCKKANNNQNNQAGLANPASVYCEENEGKLEMRGAEGGTSGWCIFPDGSQCEEWAYFRGECQPSTNWQENPVITAIKNGDLLQCVVGRDIEGRNQIKLVEPKNGCPGMGNEQALQEFCGKDTAQVAYCDDTVKLTSSLSGAGSMFYKDGQVLTCPTIDFPNLSDDCQNAFDKKCTITVDCQ